MVTKNQTAKAEKNSQTTSLLDQVMEQTRFKPENEDYSIAQRGIAEFISEMLKSDSTDAKTFNKFRSTSNFYMFFI